MALRVLTVLARRHAIDIYRIVDSDGPVRYGAIEASVDPSSTSTLADRLAELEAIGVVTREQYDEVPPRVEYELTDAGRELRAHLDALEEWERNWLDNLDEGGDLR